MTELQNSVNRIAQNIANTYSVLSALGADMPEEQNSDNLAETAGTAKAVLYSEQTLTDEQKAQARENIGAAAQGETGASSWNDLTDKPVVAVGGDTLTWDGNTEGLEKLIYKYKVSDTVLTEDLAGKRCTVTTALPDGTVNAIETTVVAEEGVVTLVDDNEYDYVESFSDELGALLGLGGGTYFRKADSYFVTSITIPGFTGFDMEKLDPAFLPMDETPTEGSKNPVTSGGVFEALKNAGSGLTVPVGSPDTLTWDGNTEGLVGVADMFYKVSDAKPTIDELTNGGSFSISNYDKTLSGAIIADNIQNMGYGVLNFGNFLVVVPDEAAGVDVEGLVFPAAGTYFAVGYSEYSITIPGYTGFAKEKIAPSYLYQPDWNQTDETAADFIKNKPFGDVEMVLYEGTNLEPIEDSGSYMLMTPADFVFVEGAQYTVVVDGVEYVTEPFALYGTFICLGNPALMGAGDDNGMPFLAGVGLVAEGELAFASMSAFSALSIFSVQAKRIDDKYAPSPAVYLYSDTDRYLYTTNDQSDTSNRLTSKELRALVASGKTIYVIDNTWYCSAAAISTTGVHGTIRTLNYSTGRLNDFYTAEYVPTEG